jgi:putative transposase
MEGTSLFNVEEFATLHEAQVIIEARRTEYNTYRPHSSLADLTPAEYAATWTGNTPTELS